MAGGRITLETSLEEKATVDFDTAARHLDGIPMTRPEQGKVLYDFVIEQRPRHILELGFAHGVSTCYMAAALHELGEGHITTIDKVTALNREPSIHDVVGKLGLTDYITPVFAENSHTWELMKMLESSDSPRFDFVFNDGGHTWDVAGFAFFLTDKLLNPGGWMLFDDLRWTLASSPALSERNWVKALPEEQRETAQVGKVFDLLVSTHPGYTDVKRTRGGNWGWARKR